MAQTSVTSALKLGIIFMLIGFLQSLYEYVILLNYSVIPDSFHLTALIIANLSAGFIAGLISGFFVLPLVNRWLRQYSYGRTLLAGVFVATIIFSVVSLLGSIIFNMVQNGSNIFNQDTWNGVLAYMFSTENLKNYVFWLSVIGVAIIGHQINDKYGPGNFIRFLLGKYFVPTKNHKLFMFIDLKGSTGIAERLSEVDYFEFLKDFFKDITPCITLRSGQVYQYVGDEIVVFWETKDKAAYTLAIQSFIQAKVVIEEKYNYYLSKYQVAPEFKAGVHAGESVTGEMGIVKREIVFSGDTLNTTARLQSMCNEYDVDILLSKEVISKCNPKDLPPWHIQKLGTYAIKGKWEKMELYTVKRGDIHFS